MIMERKLILKLEGKKKKKFYKIKYFRISIKSCIKDKYDSL